MNSTFKHIILTRFGINYERGKRLKKGTIEYDSELWINNAFNLFERFAFPFLNNQKNKNFTWIILTDSKLPQKHLSRLESYSKVLVNIKIHQIPQAPQGLRADVIRNKIIHIIENYAKGYEYLITTRLDSDDFGSDDYIDLIHKSFEPRTFVMDYDNLFRFDINDKIIKKHVPEFTSTFISFVEVNKDIQTVYKYSHNLFKDFYTVKKIGKGYCVQTVHDLNVSTTLIGSDLTENDKELLKDLLKQKINI